MKLDKLSLAHALLALEWRAAYPDTLRTQHIIGYEEQMDWWWENSLDWRVIRDNDDKAVGYCGVQDIHDTYAEISFLMDPANLDDWEESFDLFIHDVFSRWVFKSVTSEVFVNSRTARQWLNVARKYGAREFVLPARKVERDELGETYTDAWLLVFERGAVCGSSC